MLNKLKSRKLWAALLGLLTGVAMIFGVEADTVSTVSGAVVAVSGVVTYIITEGRIDAAAIGAAAEQVNHAVDALQE